jgi:hypothetical protein
MGPLAKDLYIYGATRPKPPQVFVIFMGLLAPNPRKLLKKLDQNFQTGFSFS